MCPELVNMLFVWKLVVLVDRKAIFVVIIIIQCASLSDGHAGLEMGSPSSPLLKPFRGPPPPPSPCLLQIVPREEPFATICLSIRHEEEDIPAQIKVNHYFCWVSEERRGCKEKEHFKWWRRRRIWKWQTWPLSGSLLSVERWMPIFMTFLNCFSCDPK